MKIVLLTSEFLPVFGGIGAYARELANAGSRLDHEIVIVAPDYFQDNSALDAELPYQVIRFDGGRHSMKDLLLKIKLMWQLRHVFQDADIIHAIDWPFYIPLAIANRFVSVNTRKYVTYHGTEINYMQSRIRRLILSLTSFWSGWATFVANSTYTEKLLLSAFPCAAKSPIKTVPLGVNSPKYSFARKDARDNLEIAAGDFVVLTVGRMVRRKGHLILAKALKFLHNIHATKIQWIICGPEGDKEYMEELDTELTSLPVRVRKVGAVPDDQLARYYAATDLFCLTSEVSSGGQVEGFGLVYLEAAAYGVPALGTRVGGIPDAVLDGKTGVLVPANDLESIAKELTMLMDNPIYLEKLGQAAKQHAQSETWENVFSKTYGT